MRMLCVCMLCEKKSYNIGRRLLIVGRVRSRGEKKGKARPVAFNRRKEKRGEAETTNQLLKKKTLRAAPSRRSVSGWGVGA